MEEIESLKESHTKAIADLKETHGKAVQNYQKKIRGINLKVQRLTNLVTSLQADLETANQTIAEVEMTKTEYEAFLKDVPSQSDKQKIESIRKLRITNRQLTKKVNDSKKKIEEANEKCTAAVTVNSRNEMTLADYRNQLANLNSQLQSVTKRLSMYERQNTALQNKVKKFDQQKLDTQRNVAADKKETMKLAIENEEKKRQTKKELITHASNEKMREKDYDQLLKQQDRAARAKERQNRFRQVGDRVGGTNHLVINSGGGANSLAHETGLFGKLNSLLGDEDPLLDDAVYTYLETKFKDLIKGLVRKKQAILAGMDPRMNASTPTKRKQAPEVSTPETKRARPKNAAEALRMCPPGWDVFFDKKTEVFYYQEQGTGKLRNEPPYDHYQQPVVSPEGVAVCPSALPQNDIDCDNDDEINEAIDLLDSSTHGGKTTGLDDDDDDMKDDEGNENKNMEKNNNEQDFIENDINDDAISKGNGPENDFGISQTFKMPPSVIGCTLGQLSMDSDQNDD